MNSVQGARFSRRRFVGSAAAGLATVAATPMGSARAQTKARYMRYNVTGASGQAMLASYATALKNLMALKPTDAHNLFRNAFVHTMDCPHGNWWFFVWHRGYLGWWEKVLRDASGNKDFAIPYWDWTELPRIPAGMFDDVLNPSNPPYNPYIKDFATFFKFMNPSLTAYWNGLNAAQMGQLNTRMMPTLTSLWQQVKGNQQSGAMFAPTQYARYLTASNPDLDANTKKMVAPDMIRSGLAPTEFSKFNSIQTPSHNTQPASGSQFAILEGNPHNKVHNNIGGVGHISNPLNFGYMADNLSPVDPIFFLHHANMDRLWDVWTRKQQKLGLAYLPTGADLVTFQQEPFLFFADPNGNAVPQQHASDYVNMSVFDYDYEPGFGEDVIGKPALVASAAANGRFKGMMTNGVGAVTVPQAALQQNSAAPTSEPLVVQVTVPHPASASAPREFNVLINAPPGNTQTGADSPYYAGTIAFFGFMQNMTGDATFVVPLPRNMQIANGVVNVQVIPRGPPSRLLAAAAPAKSVLKAVAVTAW
jgi:tyrosinase